MCCHALKKNQCVNRFWVGSVVVDIYVVARWAHGTSEHLEKRGRVKIAWKYPVVVEVQVTGLRSLHRESKQRADSPGQQNKSVSSHVAIPPKSL
jgi:hypothetical protein